MTRPRWSTLALLVVLALFATGCASFGAPDGYTIQARFPRTFNLFPGSPVQVLGIERGIVRELDVEEGSDTVLATLTIDHDAQLPEDVRAVVLTDALLGERYVQLEPPYDGEGPTLEPGTTLEEPGDVPAEFDELLDALNDFVEGVEGGDLPRLVDNLAEVLDGNGENLGQTLESTQDALQVLQDHDQDIIRLASKLSDVNETLNTRRNELGVIIQDFAELSQVLADQREPLDRSLTSLARLADETGRLLDTNRTLLERDVATLTRVGQTAVRNLDQLSAMFLNSAELFRHSERAIDRDHNWLPLVNNTDHLVNYTLGTIQSRIGLLCEREGLPTEVCDQLADLIDEIVPGQICLPPILACAEADEGDEPDGPAPLDDVLTDQLTGLAESHEGTPEEEQQVDDFIEDVLGGIGSTLTGDADDTGGDSSTSDDGGGLLDGLGGRQ